MAVQGGDPSSCSRPSPNAAKSLCVTWMILASFLSCNFLLCLKKQKVERSDWANSEVPSSSKFICLSNSLIFAKALAMATAWRQSLQTLQRLKALEVMQRALNTPAIKITEGTLLGEGCSHAPQYTQI